MECQGECKKENRCFGKLKTVLVSGNGFKKPFEFVYCQEAREEDTRRGFLVEEVDEHGLTKSDYYTGITIQNP